ncbi:MAG TPA: excinuclease ABC subunit UvrC [Alphaproteobacteria bacterium]
MAPPDGKDVSADEAIVAQPAGTSLERGAGLIRSHARALPNRPGVYRMLDARGDALYVGKARDLKKRVATYAQVQKLPNRLRRMVAETASLEVVSTHTEVEALLLESNLIKRLTPRYNLLLRDDKSFPNILLTGDHAFPQVSKHRGSKSRKGEYFGPFASAGAVNRTITTLQKAFLLRSCSDAVFQSRTRPCLQFQIKRCSAPCVGRISEQDYAGLVAQARRFLCGESSEIQAQMAAAMQKAADAMDYEAAAGYRDRLRALTQVQAHQGINLDGLADADVIAAHQEGGHSCIQVFFFRGGSNFGNRAYFPAHDKDMALPFVVAGFLGQFYESRTPPPCLLLSHSPGERELIEEALSVRAGRRVHLSVPQRGAKRQAVEHALANAREALGRRLSETSSQRRLLQSVGDLFGLEGPPQRIEVYDNSHIQGASPYGAMIVAGPEGFRKNSYRKFTIRGEAGVPAAAGDDYAMTREVLTRRFSRALKEDPGRDQGAWPDLVLIDGGPGQLAGALDVFAELGIEDLAVAAIAKGTDRDAGRERIHLPGREPITLAANDPVLYFLQRLRDEAHRFAIGTHRARRSKLIGRSVLDEIGGIGGARKRALLHHFGSARNVARAGLADLEAVPGISKTVAKKIYDHFHGA